MCNECFELSGHKRGCPNAEEEVFDECIECGDIIYMGDPIYDVHGEIFCEECIEKFRKWAGY